MALTVPDYANASFVEQAGLDSVDIDAIVAALDDSVVVAGCLVTQRAAGANLSVDVAAGTVAVQGGLATVAGGNVAVTADATNPRWALISANSSGTVAATLGTAAALPVFPAIPASSVPLAAVWIPAAAGSILNANIVDKRPISAAPTVVASGAAGTSALVKYGRTADELHVGIDVAAGEQTDSAPGDFVHRLADNTKTMRWGFGATSTASRMQLTNTALTLPSGQALNTGPRSVVTGTRATTTNASDTVDLGTFSSTGGAIELRIHAHLAAPASGATASVTKVYEITASALMGTASTWYKALPADMSANQATTNDFALEVQRTASGTFQFRFRQVSIGAAGAITFTVETLGDAVVAFTPSTTVTAAPTAVTTPHPSNPFVAAAGRVGIGTDVPDTSSTLHLLDPLSVNANRLFFTQSGFSSPLSIGIAGSSGKVWASSSTGDSEIAGSGTLRLGISGVSLPTLNITGADVQIVDNGTARTVPRGLIFDSGEIVNATPPSSTSTTLWTMVTSLADFGAITFTNGIKYKITVNIVYSNATVTNGASLALMDGGASAPVTTTTPTKIWRIPGPGSANVHTTQIYSFTGNGAIHHFGLAFRSIGGTSATMTGASTTDGQSRVLIEAVG